MEKIKVDKAKLIAVLQENKAKHRALFEKAWEGYREKAIQLLTERLDALRAGKHQAVYFIDKLASALAEATTRRDMLGVDLAEAQQRIFHLEAALADARRDEGWQPIETAPKDGQRDIIVEDANAHRVLAHYMSGGFCIEDHPAIDEGWFFWSGRMYDRFSKPVRWRYALPSRQEEKVQRVTGLRGVPGPIRQEEG